MEGDFIMASISSIANNSYLMYSIASKGNTSITPSSWITGNVSTSTTASTSTSASTLKNLVSSWENYTSGLSGSTSSAAASTASSLSTLSSLKSNMSSLLSSYSTASKTFYAQFDSTMSDLKSSASVVAKMNYNVTGSTDSESASKLSTVLSNIKSFVSDYNDATNFFSGNSSVSTRVSRLASTFADTVYNAKTYAKIGINVDTSTGKVSINETKLSAALKENPDRVENLLGANGLAGKATNKISLAESQKSNLFPSVSTMLGSTVNTASLYSPKTLTAMTNYSNIGNLIDMYF